MYRPLILLLFFYCNWLHAALQLTRRKEFPYSSLGIFLKEPLMKKLILVAALGLSAITMSTQAATVAQAFNVSATLTAQCVSNNSAPSDVNFGAYTAFGAAATPAPTSAITFRCTKGYAATPTASLGAGGTSGTIAGLAYTLGVGAGVKTAGASGAAGTVGTYDVYSYTITGAMAAGQAGDSSASTTPVVHTLTITY
jgi:hypothetical protein